MNSNQEFKKRVISVDFNSQAFSTRICLGLFEGEDTRFLYELINDRTVQSWLGGQSPVTLEDEKKFVERSFRNSDTHNFGIFLKHKNKEPLAITHQLIGTMGLGKIDHINGRAESGANIHPDFHSKGYGFEAKMLLLDYAFNRLNLRKVASTAHADNQKSIEHNKKAGYQTVGMYKKDRYINGQFKDVTILECFREDWQPIWEKFITGEFVKK